MNPTAPSTQSQDPLSQAGLTNPDKKIPVIEFFGPTIQGEGSVIGYPTYFIRIGGCDYRCARCDSLHAVLPDLIKQNAKYYTVEEATGLILANVPKGHMITLSGGNPCIWDLSHMIVNLNRAGIGIAVETQGTILPEWLKTCDFVTVSPKGPGMGEKFYPEKFDKFMNAFTDWFDGEPYIWHKGFSVKVVIFDQRDIEFVKSIVEKWPWVTSRLFLSLGNPYPPEPAQRDPDAPAELTALRDSLLSHMRTLTEDILQEPLLHQARLLPQLHVLLWGNERGR